MNDESLRIGKFHLDRGVPESEGDQQDMMDRVHLQHPRLRCSETLLVMFCWHYASW